MPPYRRVFYSILTWNVFGVAGRLLEDVLLVYVVMAYFCLQLRSNYILLGVKLLRFTLQTNKSQHHRPHMEVLFSEHY